MSWITSLPPIAASGICSTSRQEVALEGDPCVHQTDIGPPYTTPPYGNDFAPLLNDLSRGCGVYINGRQVALDEHPAEIHMSNHNTTAVANSCGSVRFCGNRKAHRLGEERECGAITVKYENDTAGRFNIF
jgi:hypothetical protein